MALKRQQPPEPFLPVAGGFITSCKDIRLVGGAQEEVASQLWYHTQPHPFNRPGDLGSHGGPTAPWVVAAPLQVSASPPLDAGSGLDIPGVPASAQLPQH